MNHSPTLKVCLITTSFPRWPQDDQGTFVLELAKALCNQGLTIKVIAPHAPGAQSHEILEGVTVIRPRYIWPERFELLRRYRAGLPVILRKHPSVWFLLPLFALSHFIALLRYARDCDVIHANWTISASISVLASIFINKPVVASIHGSDVYETKRIQWLGIVTRFFLTKCDQIIAMSKSLVNMTIQLGITPAKIARIPDGVDPNYFTPLSGDRSPVILFVGSLIQRKGVDYLIEAAPKVFARNSDYRLVLIGEGPLDRELERRAQFLGVGDKIELLGALSPDHVRDWMQRSKLLVLPSVEEGLGVVLLEALACGTPCIATNIGGIPDIIHDQVGRLVPARDADALADSINSLLDNPEEWKQKSTTARTYIVENYAWERIAGQIADLYRRVVDQRLESFTSLNQ